jgi:hypothetical protein
VWNGCSTVVRWWFRVGVWGVQTLTIASAGDRTSTATRRSVPTRRPPQYRDRDSYDTADRDRDSYDTADRDRDSYDTADRDRDSYDTADRDRDSTATRSGATGIFDRNRDRTATVPATAPHLVLPSLGGGSPHRPPPPPSRVSRAPNSK